MDGQWSGVRTDPPRLEGERGSGRAVVIVRGVVVNERIAVRVEQVHHT